MTALAVGGGFVGCGLSLGAAPADAGIDVKRCQRTVANASARFAQGEARALARCELRELAGALPMALDCRGDERTAATLARLEAKLATAIVRACGGADRACGADLAGEIGGNDLGFTGVCPNFEQGVCTGAIGGADCSGVASCLACIGGAAVERAVALAFGSLAPSLPGSLLNRCQHAIGKATASFVVARSEALRSCWDRRLRGKHAGDCSPPGDPDGRVSAAIARAEARHGRTICRACGGEDGRCDGVSDLTPAAIGFPPSCPPVAGPAAQDTCGGAVTDLASLVACVECVSGVGVECVDRAAVPGLAPLFPECNSDPATPTATPSPTATPVPSATATTPPPCRNGLDEPGEACDDFTQPPWYGCGSEFSCTHCTCACPTIREFTPDPAEAATRLDWGWSGVLHDRPLAGNATVTLAVSCAEGSRPCGVCDLTGPVANPDARNGRPNVQRCTGDTRVTCGTAPGGIDGCGGALGTCEFFFGSSLATSGGGVPLCLQSHFEGAVSGTVNVETGEEATAGLLRSRVHVAESGAPCPICDGDGAPNDGIAAGFCVGGLHDGLGCDADGDVPGHPDLGATSLDCPPAPALEVANLPIFLERSTATVAQALTSTSPNCTDSGAISQKCLCDTCNNAGAQPCSSNADCPAPPGPIGAVCGGRRCISGSNAGMPCFAASQCPAGSCGRPGAPTKPSACVDDPEIPGDGSVCVDTPPLDDGMGECPELPMFTCAASSGHPQRGCLADQDCCDDPPGCVADPVTPGACQESRRSCFVGGGIVAAGVADRPVADMSEPTLAAVFCVPPTTSPSVNAFAGLPGPGRLLTKGTAISRP